MIGNKRKACLNWGIWYNRRKIDTTYDVSAHKCQALGIIQEESQNVLPMESICSLVWSRVG